MSAARRLADPGSGFAAKLIVLAAAGLALRLVYGFSLNDPSGDAVFYHQVANRLADGDGFTLPFLGATAAHPPLFPLLLAVGSLLGATGMTAHQAIGCALGASNAVVAGFAGRRLGGSAVGLIAAAVAAVYPPLLANDSLLLSESVYELTIALTILAALRVLELPSRGRVLVLGLAIGLASLARAEALLLVPLLGLPLALRLERSRLLSLGLVCLGAVVVVLPWTVRNLAAFDRFVLISTNDGSVIAGANCPSTYGPLLGQWDLACSLRAGSKSGGGEAEARALRELLRGGSLSRSAAAAYIRSSGGNEAVVAARQRRRGLSYARHHAGRVPKVVAARVGRTWSVYGVSRQVRLNRFFRRSPSWLEWLTVGSFYAAALLAALGAFVLRRRWGELIVLAAPLVLVTLSSALGFGTPRFRAAAEVAIVLLASVALAPPFSARERAG